MAVKKKAEAKATENTEAMGNVNEDANEEATATAETAEATGATPEAPVGENEVTGETETTENATGDESGDDTGITVDPEPTPEAPVSEGKKVKIMPNCDYRFYYGTQWYTLRKGVVMTVPVEVKERLQKSGKLSAL